MWVAPTSPPSLFSRTVRERTDEELAALVAVVKEHAVQQKRSHGMQRRQSKKNAVPERREVQRQADHKGLYLNIAKTWVNMPDHKLRIVTSADGVTRMQAGHVPALIDILVHPTGAPLPWTTTLTHYIRRRPRLPTQFPHDLQRPVHA